MTSRYHYTECGLDYVYLENGFRLEETPYGAGVSIEDADELHETIALAIIMSPHAIRGQELRFLRSMLDVSQAGLGDLVGKSRAAIARWEAGTDDPIPGEADRLLRMFYALKVNGHDVAVKILDLLTQIDELQHRIALFEDTETGWRSKEAA